MYIVTGGAGFIGSALLWRLNKADITDILVVDNLGSTEKWKNLVNRSYSAYMHRTAFLDAIEHKTFSGAVEAVIHLGACSSTTEKNADFLMANNTAYSIAVCRFALEHGARFVNASSAATYGNGSQGFSDQPDTIRRLKPLNMYGYSKQLFDLWLLDNKLTDSVVSLKFFNVYGPNEYHKKDMRSVVCKAFHEIAATGRLRLFKSCHADYRDGGQMRDFIYVKDCVELIFQLLTHPHINGIRNAGTGKARTWNDLGRAVFSAMEREPAIEYVDMPEYLLGKYQNFTQADMGWLCREGRDLTFNCASLEKGVEDYVRNYLTASDPYLEMV
ncbi:MAG: ADP-glyceromanno-heptose 6-epimerase [Desulfovibrio sp.]|nr:ADP-glyceromanno-heptose 6-epimerase [Desulfovibrio sp.]